jgi:sugar/nucleoside kinase (ribokinase family)
VKTPRFVALDTMNYWITGMLPTLKKTIARVDLLTLNDQEVAQLSGEKNVLTGARKILKMGPKTLIVKRGEFGAALVTNESYFWIPSFPVEKVIDPTGAGDTFAGAFMGYLAKTNDLSEPNLRRAIVYGTVLASFCVEDFSLNRLRNIPKNEINERFLKLLDMIKCDSGEML